MAINRLAVRASQSKHPGAGEPVFDIGRSHVGQIADNFAVNFETWVRPPPLIQEILSYQLFLHPVGRSSELVAVAVDRLSVQAFQAFADQWQRTTEGLADLQ